MYSPSVQVGGARNASMLFVGGQGKGGGRSFAWLPAQKSAPSFSHVLAVDWPAACSNSTPFSRFPAPGFPDSGRQFSFVVSVNFFFAVHRPRTPTFAILSGWLHLVKCGPPLPAPKVSRATPNAYIYYHPLGCPPKAHRIFARTTSRCTHTPPCIFLQFSFGQKCIFLEPADA